MALGLAAHANCFGADARRPPSPGWVLQIALNHPAKVKRIIYLSCPRPSAEFDLVRLQAEVSRIDEHRTAPPRCGWGKRSRLTSGQSIALLGFSPFEFKTYGRCVMEFSELLAEHLQARDDICLIRSDADRADQP